MGAYEYSERSRGQGAQSAANASSLPATHFAGFGTHSSSTAMGEDSTHNVAFTSIVVSSNSQPCAVRGGEFVGEVNIC